MADAEHVVTPLPRPLPEKIAVPTSLTPNEMRALKARPASRSSSCSAVMPTTWSSAPDRLQAHGLVRAAPRRLTEATWEQAGDVSPDTEEVAADPSRSGS